MQLSADCSDHVILRAYSVLWTPKFNLLVVINQKSAQNHHIATYVATYVCVMEFLLTIFC